jgi:uncharacterized membrane protein YbhN (UPF0104 family)
MRETLRTWWPVLKAVLALAVLVGVGWFFVGILRSEALRQYGENRSPAEVLWAETRAARPAGLVLCVLLYLLGLGFSGAYWLLLLRRAGAPLPASASFRIYYISHLGKYAPLGKGWALLLRTSLSASAGVRPGVAALTAAYETLTTMAAGVLLACILLAVRPGADAGLLWRCLGLLVLAGVPILPGVFNRVVARLAARFGAAGPMPRPSAGTLLTGLAMTACGWALLGASAMALVLAMLPEPNPWDVALWLQCVAAVAISWVAGFVVSTPGGLGVREIILQQFLAAPLGGRAVVVAILLRVLWTVAELLMAGVLYWVPTPNLSPKGVPAGREGEASAEPGGGDAAGASPSTSNGQPPGSAGASPSHPPPQPSPQESGP